MRQKELAQRVGASAAYLSLVESEKRSGSLDFLGRAAKVLQLPIELLLIEAKEQEGGLSPEQSELFSKAKSLMLLASKLEREGRGGTDAKTQSKSSVLEHSKSRSSRAASRRAASSSRAASPPRRVALQSDKTASEKARRKASRD